MAAVPNGRQHVCPTLMSIDPIRTDRIIHARDETGPRAIMTRVSQPRMKVWSCRWETASGSRDDEMTQGEECQQLRRRVEMIIRVREGDNKRVRECRELGRWRRQREAKVYSVQRACYIYWFLRTMETRDEPNFLEVQHGRDTVWVRGPADQGAG